MAADDHGPAPVDRRGALPLWAQVAADLQRRLSAGALADGFPRGAAAFFVQRLGCSGGRPVEWRETVVRGDRYAFVAEWSSRRPELEPSAQQLSEGRTR